MAALDWHYLRVRTLPGFGRTEAALRRRFQSPTGFFMGFMRVLGNPAVLLYWVAVAASLTAHGVASTEGADGWLA